MSVQAREADRVTVLVRRFGPRVLGYLARRTGHREEAADLFSQTLATVWRRRADLPDDDDEALAWMIGVARMTLANGVRASRRRDALVRRLRDEIVVRTAHHGTSDVSERVRAALARLPEHDQEVLRLDAWDGLTGDQVAQVLGISAPAARQRLARARARLRKELEVRDAPRR
ncbi:RNA polymerase sigma factor [Cellulomonas composti]|uniref:DNA-directed RNA polymerase sigma-70 factor n=1 Tax=Cellulomonas composti TaxID=266130 RepID=A0A511J890_9CELL|nr:sigma-70 family RNA polymerase sigma factor [Cellulomonas composti]GEL94217.1 hypothetical protein CCO02nite_08750 [Cellulomonas composti]